ncbi:MAG: hypothetical protein U0X20_28440 [Caldilineaceae bacterium]
MAPSTATQTPGLYLYQVAFTYGKFGYATAIGTALMIITLAFSYFTLPCSLSGGLRCRRPVIFPRRCSRRGAGTAAQHGSCFSSRSLTYLPFAMMLQQSFKDNKQFFTSFWLPTLPLHFENYVKAFPIIYATTINTLLYAIPTLIIVLTVSGLTGFAF